MNEEIKAKWVAALRSGEYKQTAGCLRSGGNYCVLGVLCDLYNNSNWVEDKEMFFFRTEGNKYYADPPKEVREWAGIGWEEETKLMRLNDEKCKTFDQLADYIDSNL